MQFLGKVVASQLKSVHKIIRKWRRIFKVGSTQASSYATSESVFVCDIFWQMPTFPIMISTTKLLAKITLNLEVWGFASQIYKTSFSKSGSKTQIYKPVASSQNLQSCLCSTSLKFTEKVTVNHMLPFPSALYTFVTLVYNKQTNKHYVNSDSDHCILPFMYWQSCIALGGDIPLVGQERNQKCNNFQKLPKTPTNPITPKSHKSNNSHNSHPRHDRPVNWDMRLPWIRISSSPPATDIRISIHSCSCHPSVKEMKKSKLDML